MPGPKATNRKRQAPAPNSPNRKQAARLQRRIDAYVPVNTQNGQKMHKPGSRKK